MQSMIYSDRKFYWFSILVVFSSLFLTQILPFSPFYFGMFFSAIFLFIIFSFLPRFCVIKISCDDRIIFIPISFLLFHIVLNTAINSVSIKYPLLMILSYLFFIFSFCSNSIPIQQLKKSLVVLKKTTLILLIIECAYRITHPRFLAWAEGTSDFFYMYKFSSIMFSDTNETGFFILSFLSFLVYLKDKQIIPVKRIEIFVGFTFLVLSFSRAAIFGFLVFALYQFVFKTMAFMLKLFCVYLTGFGVAIIVGIFMNDGSFMTKIDIFQKTLLYLKNCDIFHFLFGIGMNHSIDALGIYGHNYLSLYSIEFGIVGLVLFLSFIILVLLKRRHTIFLWMPFLITGLSFVSYFLPFFYFHLGLVYNFEKRGDLCKN